MRKTVVKIAIMVAFLLTVILIAIGIFYPINKKAEDLKSCAFSGFISVNGKDWAPIENGVEDNKQNIIYLKGNFSIDINEGENVWLRLENAGVIVKINGETVLDHLQENEYPPIFSSPGYSWKSFTSSGIKTSDTVEITLKSYYGKELLASSALLESLFVGDGSGFTKLILNKFGFTGIISLIAIFVGIIYIVEGILSLKIIKKSAKRISLFGLYSLFGGLWAFTDSLYPYVSILFSPPWFVSILDMIGFLLFPVAILSLIHFYIRGSKTKIIMDYLCLSATLVAIICLLSQLFGFYDLYEIQFLISISSIIQLIIGTCCIISDLKIYKDSYLTILIFSILPVLIAIALDGINVFFPFTNRRIFMRYGLCFSFVALTYQIICYAKLEKRIEDNLMQMEKQVYDSKISIMLSQIQPHFLYNALGTIRALCLINANTARTAIEYFSNYLRGNMDSLTQNEPIPFENDLKHLENFLYIEKLRFGDKIKIEYDLKVKDFKCPALTLQPLVENAIKHGLMKKSEGGVIKISTFEGSDKYCIVIEDNGVGINNQEKINDGNSHVGLLNTERRIVSMCGGTFQINSEMGQGTKININIPKGISNEAASD